MIKICAVDHSITSPSICLFYGDQFTLDNCSFHIFSSNKKFAGSFDYNITGYKFKENDDYEQLPFWKIERAKDRAEVLSEIVCEFKPDHFIIEGFSFGSNSGLAFDIAECATVFKERCYTNLPNTTFSIIPPKTLKKFATGNGQANKELMFASFYGETQTNLMECFFKPNKKTKKMSVKIKSPVSDIVDSYFIAKYKFTELISIL